MKMLKSPISYFLALITLIFATGFTLNPASDLPEVEKLKYEDLAKYINSESDTLYIINFWATWCKPCVDELPYFEKISKKYAGQKIKVLLVSVDYPKHYESRVLPFVEHNIIHSKAVLLDEKDPNDWMPKISKEWKGSIPATMFIYHPENVKAFYEKEFTFNELKTKITEITES